MYSTSTRRRLGYNVVSENDKKLAGSIATISLRVLTPGVTLGTSSYCQWNIIALPFPALAELSRRRLTSAFLLFISHKSEAFCQVHFGFFFSRDSYVISFCDGSNRLECRCSA